MADDGGVWLDVGWFNRVLLMLLSRRNAKMDKQTLALLAQFVQRSRHISEHSTTICFYPRPEQCFDMIYERTEE